MAKDIKLFKDGNEITINETQLDSFISLGWKQEKENISLKKENEDLRKDMQKIKNQNKMIIDYLCQKKYEASICD